MTPRLALMLNNYNFRPDFVSDGPRPNDAQEFKNWPSTYVDAFPLFRIITPIMVRFK
jgi:hypothetical protein